MCRPLRVRYSRPALAEIDAICRAQNDPQASADLAIAIEAAIDLVRHLPAEARKTNLRSLRVLALRERPYIIFVRIRAGELLVAHVLHSPRRHPGFQDDRPEFAGATG